MNVLRATLLASALGTALAARANLINFDNVASGTVLSPTYTGYLASDGVTFDTGTVLARSGLPSSPNAFYPGVASLVVNSPTNVLTTSVGFAYTSNSVLSGTSGGVVPSLTAYSGQNGTGVPLGTLALPDTDANLATFSTVALPFAGNARSFVLSNPAYTHLIFDNLSFTSQPAPEPATLAALALGAAAMLRRRRRA